MLNLKNRRNLLKAAGLTMALPLVPPTIFSLLFTCKTLELILRESLSTFIDWKIQPQYIWL